MKISALSESLDSIFSELIDGSIPKDGKDLYLEQCKTPQVRALGLQGIGTDPSHAVSSGLAT